MSGLFAYKKGNDNNSKSACRGDKNDNGWRPEPPQSLAHLMGICLS